MERYRARMSVAISEILSFILTRRTSGASVADFFGRPGVGLNQVSAGRAILLEKAFQVPVGRRLRGNMAASAINGLHQS